METFTWNVDAGASETTQLVVNRVEFGDGYGQTTSSGINNTRVRWSISKKGYSAEINAIHAFLIRHGGVIPFKAAVSGTMRTYITEGDIVKSHVGADVWLVTFNIKQEFIP